ncbi:MAG: hypothetical protein FWD47_01500 [Treponema sp.]|nr:hypothetical protein [Treponema sp.]
MKIKILILLIFFASLSVQLYAMGFIDSSETEILTQNNEWILCITDFDTSSLPAEKINISSVVTRKMVEKINTVSFRTRVLQEYNYYVNYTWYQQRLNASRSLSVKLNERSNQVYIGESNWRYRQNITRLDADIERLRSVLQEIEDNTPLINKEPEFNLTPSNLNLIFPQSPAAGTEFRFCNEQKADAFLSGSISDFHGRYYLTIKLYTVYTRSYVWEDNIIFSLDDLDNALDEITRRLLSVLSGNRPATLVIRAQPDDTLVLINRTFAARGESETLEYPPGVITVSASAANHESLTFETELFDGEHVEFNIYLNPVEYAQIEIFSNKEGSVYHGALYVGEAPLTLRLPVNQIEYLELETIDQWKSSIIFQTPDNSDVSQSIFLQATIPLQSGRVDRDRQWFYWVWGGTWITGIGAWLAYNTFVSADTGIRINYAQTGTYDENLYNYNMNMSDLYTGMLVAVGVVSVYGLYRLVRYIHTSNKGSTPIIKTGGN